MPSPSFAGTSDPWVASRRSHGDTVVDQRRRRLVVSHASFASARMVSSFRSTALVSTGSCAAIFGMVVMANRNPPRQKVGKDGTGRCRL